MGSLSFFADDTDNVVQPDISILYDPDKLDHIGCNDNPDLIVEVLSPSTAKHDRLRKFELMNKMAYRNIGSWI
ncbi:Uma2 family endonuclease [Salicibibacter kimchii]|uniref:Uma2 family endonuclease n=1 Tax=Salicibibacter kimchii TaxID=2099786 RepID=A0A345BXM3_9BACI|nr:Uma2 family endonuclease [Salicibibacter kimchii]